MEARISNDCCASLNRIPIVQSATQECLIAAIGREHKNYALYLTHLILMNNFD
jgi:hypothetical protein